MKASVLQAFPEFTERFEGRCPWMYLDIKGLVTTGIGNLIDPEPEALRLSWMNPDGSYATLDQIAKEWSAVKSHQEMRARGGYAFASITSLRLSDVGIADLVDQHLKVDESYLAKRFQGFHDWPADAQMGILSMAWAMGPAFQFPLFEKAADAGDFMTCATECRISTVGNPGVVPRNAANTTLFKNAAYVLAKGWDADALWWPAVLGA